MPDDNAESRSSQIKIGRLGDSIAYNLRLAQSASFHAFADLTGDSGLRPGDYAILQLISDNPGLGQTDLSRAIGRDKTTLTPMLQELVRKGLVLRTRHPSDGRARMLRLTADGEDRLVRLAQCAARHDQMLNDIVGADDKAMLVRLLQKITAALGA